VSLEPSPYGPVLVVGGAGAGYDPSSPNADPQGYLYPAGSSLYAPSIDPPAFFQGLFGLKYVAGCDATTEATSIIEGGPDTCTGSETDPSADWPALTTTGGLSPALGSIAGCWAPCTERTSVPSR